MLPDAVLADLLVVASLLAWLVCVVLAIWIAVERGYPLLGVILGLFFGPVGFLVACLLPERKLLQETNFLLRQLVRPGPVPPPPVELPPTEDPVYQVPLASVAPAEPEEPAPAAGAVLTLAKNGKEVGTYPLSVVRRMLIKQSIGRYDYYFDEQHHAWRRLSEYPGL